jgi:hypothetical protein
MDEIIEWSKLSTQNLQKSILLCDLMHKHFAKQIANLWIKKNHQIKSIGALKLHNVIAPN